MINLRIGSLAAVIGLSHGCGSVPSPRAEPPRASVGTGGFLDFSFARGAPVAGARLTACGRLALSTTSTERVGVASFRNRPSGHEARITFRFDRAIAEFELAVSTLRSDEYLSGFNVGNPIRLSGTLTQTADGRVTTSRPSPADDGAGTLSWLNLETQEIELVIGAPERGGVSIDSFRVACR